MPELPGKSCCGCAACVQKCPHHALQMETDDFGFFYPSIDENLCTGRGICEKICPVLHLANIEKEHDPPTYGMINKNASIRKNSSSGGVFTAVAKSVIDAGGVVFGTRFSDDFTAVLHDFTETEAGLAAFRGSKYVQSEVGETFRQCEQFLKEGRSVLFSGTPCQIAGLHTFLGKKYDNLLTIDLICHGVPAPLLWKKYVLYKVQSAKCAIKNIFFRSKTTGWMLFSFLIQYCNDKQYSKLLNEDPYMKLFLSDVCLRESCYACNFRTKHRLSDITIADFWGIDRVDSSLFDDKGTSLVHIHSEKGKDLIEALSPLFIKKEFPFETTNKYNVMTRQSPKPADHDAFFRDFLSLPFSKLLKKYPKISFQARVKRFLKLILGENGVRFVKHLLKREARA